MTHYLVKLCDAGSGGAGGAAAAGRSRRGGAKFVITTTFHALRQITDLVCPSSSPQNAWKVELIMHQVELIMD